MNALPTLFVSHGSPMLAVEDSPAGRFLDGLAARWPTPRAIVVASAHYTAAVPSVGAKPRPETIHDFGGFPATLYRLRYPAAGAPHLAGTLAARIRDAGMPVRLEPDRDLDHGVWVPLLRMFPKADIPVVPLSVDPRADAAHHYRLGTALADLRQDGVLVIGSGGFVHNLGELEWRQADGEPQPWTLAFADWFDDKLVRGEVDALLDWRRQAPHAERAHPTVEHLMPLFVALGAAGHGARADRLHRSIAHGSLALDAYGFA